MRQTIIVANWKMNVTKDTVDNLISSIVSGMKNIKSKVIVCPPYPYLSQVRSLIKYSPVKLGAQNVNANTVGAFTGEVSVGMIKDFGTEYVIVGHSERRVLYKESDQLVAAKVLVALDNGISPIFCIGESLKERDKGNTKKVIARQVSSVVDVVGINVFANVVIAYEPVWAIGTGVTASNDKVQQVHNFIRCVLAEYDKSIAQTIPILYGGSMNSSNAKDLIACVDVDGGLIGGASLKADEFLQICRA